MAAVATAQLSLLPIPASLLRAGAPMLALASLVLLALLARNPHIRLNLLVRAALLGVLIISARVALLGPPIPPVDGAAALVPSGEVRGQVDALLAP